MQTDKRAGPLSAQTAIPQPEIKASTDEGCVSIQTKLEAAHQREGPVVGQGPSWVIVTTPALRHATSWSVTTSKPSRSAKSAKYRL